MRRRTFQQLRVVAFRRFTVRRQRLRNVTGAFSLLVRATSVDRHSVQRFLGRRINVVLHKGRHGHRSRKQVSHGAIKRVSQDFQRHSQATSRHGISATVHSRRSPVVGSLLRHTRYTRDVNTNLQGRRRILIRRRHTPDLGPKYLRVHHGQRSRTATSKGRLNTNVLCPLFIHTEKVRTGRNNRNRKQSHRLIRLNLNLNRLLNNATRHLNRHVVLNRRLIINLARQHRHLVALVRFVDLTFRQVHFRPFHRFIVS